jgi:hypothetical protein
MTDAPDMDKLARRYLDLWQDQVAALVNDPSLAESMAKAYTLMTRGATAFAAAAGLPVTPAKTEAHDTNVASPASPGPASTAVPPADPGFDAVQLARRVAELEERVVRLEAALAASGGSPAPGPRRGRR